jgi:uncharacterized protein YjdB
MDGLSQSQTHSRRRWAAPAALLASLALLATLLACGGSSSSSSSTTTVTLQTITITPSNVSIGLNQSTNFIATALDSSGNAVSNLVYTWTSSAPTVAIVTNTGLATGLTAGTAQITASVTTVAATATTAATVVTSNTATVNVIPPVAKVVVTPASAQIKAGQTQQYTAQVVDANGKGIAGIQVTWQSSNAAVASVAPSAAATDANGFAAEVVTGITAGGPVVITANANGVISNPVQLTVTQ